ncbi:hypothetical protein E2C01_063823 [Portunus trituberculatus]|uniref:Uncharacterized protein n=1 Tax=Portunus trituberculatus TaxID=210409 RepID=A0A5B7HHF6_PORTR|nr:hypothetical protein [Portunus trituberculatus]
MVLTAARTPKLPTLVSNSRRANLSPSSPSSIISEPRGHRGKWPLLSDLSKSESDLVSDLSSPNPEPEKIRRCWYFCFADPTTPDAATRRVSLTSKP